MNMELYREVLRTSERFTRLNDLSPDFWTGYETYSFLWLVSFDYRTAYRAGFNDGDIHQAAKVVLDGLKSPEAEAEAEETENYFAF